MARQHKYIKRTGTKGSYQYTYADGSTRSDRNAKEDHVHRLVIGREKEHHSMSNAEIAAEVGLEASGRTAPAQLVNARVQRVRRTKRAGGSAHSYNEHQIKEAHHKPGTAEHARHERGATSEAVTPSTPARSTPARRAPVRAVRAAPAAASGAEAKREKIRKLRAKLAGSGMRLEGTGHEHLDPAPAPAPVSRPAPARSIGPGGSLEAKRSLQGLRLPGVDQTDDATDEGGTIITRDFRAYEYFTPREEDDDDPEFTGEAEALRDVKSRLSPATLAAYDVSVRNSGEKSWMTVALHPKAVPAAPEVRRKARSARAASRRASAALAEADPAVERTEVPIRRMAETSARGGNPYLDRAKEVFDRIKGNLQPERKAHAKYMLQAFERVGFNNPGEVSDAYKDISGKRNFAGAKKDFEKATFISFDEVVENKPLDMAIERMKRGYPAMQFERLKPFLKDSFKSQNPTAPPPMPVWGDLKNWADHGTARPASMSWTTPTGRVGGITQAMPQEVFDASVKDSAGKPQFPPAWMPINLMPIWNYVVKESQAKGKNPYQSERPGASQLSPEGKLSLPSQARRGEELAQKGHEGHLINSLRKYVQMRGGPDQLINIPKSKLADVSLTHADIFKAQDLSDRRLKWLIRHKIIDFVELMPFIDEELKVKKSFVLVVSKNEEPFKKSIRRKERVRKSLIEKIQGLRDEKKFSYMSRV